MGRREYGQACSLAAALDSVGERWSLLIVRELMLGPLRFSELARAVGGPPTDVLTRRLRDLERDGVVSRRELGSPGPGIVYELGELGRGLEGPLLDLARWGMGLQRAEEVVAIEPRSLVNALRVVLVPGPEDGPLVVGLWTGGAAYSLRIEAGRASGARGAAERPDLSLAGEPLAVMAAVVFGGPAEEAIEVEGDREALLALREMVRVPARLRAEAAEIVAAGVPSAA